MNGRKYSVLLFGRFDNSKINEFYSGITNQMEKDNIKITHLTCGKKGQQSWNIRQAKNVKKRYENTILNIPDQILSMDIMNIEDDAKFPPNDFLFSVGFTYTTTDNARHYRNQYYDCYCCSIIFDFSIKNKVSLNKYRDILKKCSNWYKEVIFKCGKKDVPLHYAMLQKTNHFKKFKLVSETINENYIKYSGDSI